MQILISTLAVLVCITGLDAAGGLMNMGKLSSQANMILQQSVVPGQFVRQCSCQEESICVNEMKGQLRQCAAQCSGMFGQITAQPQRLLQCVEGMTPVIYGFIDCARANMRSCVNSNAGQRIPYHDMQHMFQLGEQAMQRGRAQMMNQGMISRIRPVAETALQYGGCVKNCFTQANARGFCFDRYRCQPLITAPALQFSLKSCSRGLNWKAQAGNLCTCAQSAEVGGLQSVCPLLRAMG